MNVGQFKKVMSGGRQAVIGWISLGDLYTAEIMATSGFDLLCVEMEHSSLDFRCLQGIVQVTGAAGMIPLVRLPYNHEVFFKRALDIGCSGVIVPMVNTKEQALRAVRNAKYPPEGARGVGSGRAYSVYPDYLKTANDEIAVIVQIEHQQAVENVHDIVSTEGIDGVFIGRADLSGSMNLLGQFDHPDVEAAIETVLRAGNAAGLPVGIHCSSPADVSRRFAQGFQFAALSSDAGLFRRACVDAVQKVVRR